ncbi:hypothetical protein L208DRAFT_1409964 [Tricholoma matsutake]|nr:hypothetical protein L208DRAFT_1409964 [Tricholoma matsutake 945]
MFPFQRCNGGLVLFGLMGVLFGLMGVIMEVGCDIVDLFDCSKASNRREKSYKRAKPTNFSRFVKRYSSNVEGEKSKNEQLGC